MATGRTDHISHKAEQLVITDFKTGKHKLNLKTIQKELEKGEFSDLQLPLYHVAYQQKRFKETINLNSDPQCRIFYVFPDVEGEPPAIVTYPSLKSMVETIRQQAVTTALIVLKAAEDGGSQFRTNKGRHCEYCAANGVLCKK